MSAGLLQEVWSWKQDNLTNEDIISRLRCQTVPSGYPIHNWKEGTYIYIVILYCVTCIKYIIGEKETTVDKLRSILAQLHYRHTVREWDANGVPFRTFMYVPEVHHISNKVFYEREDEGHLFKVYVHSKTCV